MPLTYPRKHLRGSSAKVLIQGAVRAMATTNYVMVVGPGVLSGNCATTEAVHALNEIQVLGRINTVPVASRSSLDRATYRALDSNANGIVDRFQVGAWASSVREVGRPEPILALSLNKGDPADAANSTPELAMIKLGVAQAAPAPGTVRSRCGKLRGRQAGVCCAGRG